MNEIRVMTPAQIAVVALAVSMGCPDPIDAERLVMERLQLAGRANVTDRVVAKIITELEVIASEQTSPTSGGIPTG